MSFEIEQVVDHYRLDRVVDRMGNVTVFEAFDLRLLRRVALKELAADLSADPAFRARFARDAARAAQLDHPGIASVFDSNEYDGSLYFVTKFVDGVPLAELVRSRTIPVGESMRYLDQIAAALDYAHRRGVVHGSVGLGAVLIATDDTPGAAVLFDVGITKRDAGDGGPRAGWFPPATGEWSPAGPAAEPEARRVDLVGLARMAFELLTKKAPQDALASASMLEPALPSGVDEVFAAVLGDADRDMTCAGFVSALRRAMPAALLVVRAPLAPGSELPPPMPELAEPPESTGPEVRHQRAFLVSGAVAAVLLVVGVLVWQSTRPISAERGGVAPATAVAAPTTPATVAVPTTDRSGGQRGASTTRATSTTSTTSTTSSTSTTSTPATTLPSPTSAPVAVPTTAVSLNQFGDVVGQPVTAPSSPQAATAIALQERRLPGEVAVVDTPAAYYAQWLRLTTVAPTGPVIATADGYAIDAGVPVELNQFQATPEGRVVSFVECAAGTCTSATAGVQVNSNCEPGPGCNAFATNDRAVLAVLRATVTLRNPAITLIFSVTSAKPIVAVNDPYNTVHWDTDTGAMSVTLASAPPPGTAMSVTFTYDDGDRSMMAITYG